MLPEIADMSVVVWLAVLSHMLRVSLSPIDIPDVESLSSPPLCDNLVKALALQRSREEGVRRLVRPASAPPTPILLPLNFSTAVWQPPPNLPSTPPTPSQLICHLHSSLQDNSIEPKEPAPKVWTDSASSSFYPPCCLWWDLKSGSNFLEIFSFFFTLNPSVFLHSFFCW